jgi:uncharacterized membrane protein (UPF0127 family)
MLRTTDLRRITWLAACALLVLWASLARAQMGPLEELDAFPRGELTISDGNRSKHVFKVWLADTPSRQAQGLMFVRSLPQMRGMLFVYPQPMTIGMWMKNTYIPLDMVFIDAQGRVLQVVEQTTPHSLTTIESRSPALAVLEIGGGEARRLGIRAGQRVSHPALGAHQ